MSSLPHALEIDPESSLQFTITRDPATDGSDGSSRCTMTLRHPGHTKGYLAFKVSSLFCVKFEFVLVVGWIFVIIIARDHTSL